MNTSQIAAKMILYSGGNLHDINHFMKVYAYAKTIGECERLDAQTQAALEAAALMHDIACPLCREKYGGADGRHQETEGAILARAFLEGSGCSAEFVERVIFLVGHHHTLTGIDGLDYQILIEADYLVNADEGKCSQANIRNTMARVFKTDTGISLLKSMYRLD